MTIPLVFITDDHYAMPTTVAIFSAIKNKNPDTDYKIFAICDNVSQSNKNMLRELPGVQIIDNIDNILADVPRCSYVSTSALLKFMIPEIIQDYDKVLYIDGDTLINRDLGEFYNTDLAGGACRSHYAGVVQGVLGMKYGDAARLGFDTYFNSGVMLLNLKKMRDEKTGQKMIEIKKTRTDLHYMDQDVLNIAFDQNVVWCSLDYNFKPAYLKMSADQLQSEFGYMRPKSELPTIFHWADKKPWNEHVEFYRLWLKYKRKSPARNVRVKTERTPFWRKLINIINCESKI